MKAKYQKGGRLTKKRDKLTSKSDALKPGWEKDRLTKKAKETQTKIDAKMNKRKFKKFGTPLNKKSINSFRQKGGKVKTSLQYKPGYPTTYNRDSPHSKKKLDKAIARDSTSIANRGPIGDFFDDGTETSTSRKLQVNREYRDKVNNADSKTTAKKINKMKSKKQMGGSVAERMRNAKGPTPPKKMTGQETKDLGKKKLAAGRTNRRTARNMDGGAKSIIKKIAKGQRQEGRALKSKGRKMKRSDRRDKKEAEVERTRSWLQTGGSREVTFGAPKKMQKGGDAGAEERDRFPNEKTHPGIQSNTSLDLGYRSVGQMKKYNKLYGNAHQPKVWHDDNIASKKKLAKTKVNEKYNKGAMQRGGTVQAFPNKRAKVSTSGKSKKRNPNAKTPVDPRPSDEMTFLPPGTTKKKNLKGGMKYGKGGAINKKFLGGLMGAVGGMKGAEGGFGKKLMGAAKGALGGGMLGRVAGGIKGAMGGGGLKGAMAGIKGGAFGNSNPMAQQQGAQQAQGADPAMAQQDPAAAQMAQRGGMRDRRRSKKAGKDYKKNNRQRKKGSGKIYGNKNSNCYKGDC